MDLRESTRDSVKVFHEGLHVQLAVKLFCLKTFMVYGSYIATAYKIKLIYMWKYELYLSIAM